MTLKIQYKASTTVPVEVEGITPDVVREKSLAEIEKLPIFHGNRQHHFAEFFSISGDPTDARMEWEGDLSGVHWLGTKMTAGEIHVAGNIGRHVGSEMKAGSIHVAGNASDWVGGEMRGGLIHVQGRAGHLIGSAYRGSARGMTGGTILINGEVGNEVGHTMRRGLIAIGGPAGDLVGFNMLAGTILLFGDSGIRHGAGMKRGTLAFLSKNHPPILPSFRRACRFRPDYLQLVWRHLLRHDFPVPADLLAANFDLYNGDLIEGGRGEILLRV